jgi:DNA polymerase-3 subunit delta
MPEKMIHYEDFLKRPDKAPIAPICVLYGNEDLLVQTVLKQIKRRVLGDEQVSTNLTEVEADEAEPARLFDLLRTPSLFGPAGRHLVILYHAERFLPRYAALLERYRRSPSSAGSLVLLVAEDEKDKKLREEIRGQVDKFDLVVDCRRPPEWKIPGLVQRMARRLLKSIDEDGARLLMELVGSDLGQLHQQLKNLAALIADRPRITEGDVVELVGTDFQREGWDLLNAIGEGKTGEALLILDRLLRQDKGDEEPPAIIIIALLAYELRQLVQAREMLDEGKADVAVLRGLRGPRAVRQRRLREVKGITQEQIARRARLLAAADVQCKTSALPPQVALERLVLSLCRLSSPHSGAG